MGTAGGGEVDPHLSGFGSYGGPTKTAPPIFDSNVMSQVVDNGENGGVSGVFAASTYDQRESPFPRTYALTDGTTTTNYSDGTDVGAAEAYSAMYADRRWAGFSPGDVITDADPVASGDQHAIFGVNAFANVNDAIAAGAVLLAGDPTYGKVVVNGYIDTTGQGVFNENVVDNSAVPMFLQEGAISLYSLTIGTALLPSASVEITATLDRRDWRDCGQRRRPHVLRDALLGPRIVIAPDRPDRTPARRTCCSNPAARR